jgi:hypothetical protein
MIRYWVPIQIALHHTLAASQAIHDVAAIERKGVTSLTCVSCGDYEVARKQDHTDSSPIAVEHARGF